MYMIATMSMDDLVGLYIYIYMSIFFWWETESHHSLVKLTLVNVTFSCLVKIQKTTYLHFSNNHTCLWK